MKFLADENISAKIVKYLRNKDNDILYAPKGLRNSSLIDLAKSQKRILLTHDTDFANPVLYPPESFCGIIVFRIHPPIFDKLEKAITAFLSKFREREIENHLIIIEETEVIVFPKENN